MTVLGDRQHRDLTFFPSEFSSLEQQIVEGASLRALHFDEENRVKRIRSSVAGILSGERIPAHSTEEVCGVPFP